MPIGFYKRNGKTRPITYAKLRPQSRLPRATEFEIDVKDNDAGKEASDEVSVANEKSASDKQTKKTAFKEHLNISGTEKKEDLV